MSLSKVMSPKYHGSEKLEFSKHLELYNKKNHQEIFFLVIAVELNFEASLTATFRVQGKRN